MKWWKKYAFLMMIVVSGLVYRAGMLIIRVTAAPHREMLASEKNYMQRSKAGKAVACAGIANEALRELLGRAENPGQGAGNGTGVGDAQMGAASDNPSQGKGLFHRVEMDYLSDALFIGDSRTSTLYEYAGWTEVDFFVKNGLTIWDVWERTMDGRKLADVLSAKQYGKIYIMLGINELGNETADGYREQYERVLAKLEELQPGAIIFVQSIMHVTAGKDAEGTYINNGEVNARNQELQKLADNKRVFYLDVNEVMDEPGTGKLNSEYSNDGVHLKVKHIDVWREFLLDHGV